MSDEHPSDIDIDGWLHTLGITSRCQWDVLIFLYRHQTSLVGGDLIARFLGYANGPIVDAMDALEGQGLVRRSRVSLIARLYQLGIPSDPPGSDAWARLLDLTSTRAGRVRLSKHSWGGEPHRPGAVADGIAPPDRGQKVRPSDQAAVPHSQRRT
jgi:hypothetical protein